MPSDPTELVRLVFPADAGEADAATDAAVVNIAAHRKSRYERNSRALPHLGDDPNWTPSTFELPTPVADDGPERWFGRFRR